MKNKQGKDLQVGDKVIRADGQLMTIKQLTNGMARDSRIAEFDRADEHGRLWASIFNRVEYQTAEPKK